MEGLQLLAIVVTAQVHNPSILHPSFLRAEGIVPKDWEPEEPALSTAGLSRVVYQNGIEFRCDPNRLSVVNPRPPEDLSTEVLPDLVRRYLEALPKVRYTGVGINPTVFFARAGAAQTLISSLVKDGPWKAGVLQPEALDLKLVYDRLDTKFQISLADGAWAPTRRITREVQQGIIVSGNYHRSVENGEQAVAAVNRFSVLCDDFSSVVVTVLPK